MEVDILATMYVTTVSSRFELLLWICEGSLCGVCAGNQSWAKELGRGSMMRLAIMPPFSVLFVDGNTFRAGTAWMDANKAFKCAANTIRYHIYFVKGSIVSQMASTTFRTSDQGFCSHWLLVQKKSIH